MHSLGGRYITATDLGTTTADMHIIRQETPYVTACSEEYGGAGDTSVLTGLTVYMGIKAGLKEVYDDESLKGKTVMVQGAGKAGTHLMKHLANEGARLLVADIDAARAQGAASAFGAEIVDNDAVYDAECHVFSPNALGGVLNEHTIPRLKYKVIAGGANNQLATPRDCRRLQERGILYAPDYIVNCGGVINAADEMLGYSARRAEARAQAVYRTTLRLFALARERNMTTSEAADRVAEERVKVVGDIHRNFVPR